MVRRAVEYVMTWRESKGGSFSVKSCYCSFAFSNRKVFPLGIVWNPWVLRRVSFFTWEAVWERILTLDQLKRRVGVYRVDVICVKVYLALSELNGDKAPGLDGFPIAF